MAYDPNFPPPNAELISAEFRAQFQGLKTLIDALQTQMNGLLPVGFIGAWPKSRANMPALPGTWVECNGQVLDDPASPFHGQTMDDLNGVSGPQRFLRGAIASGGVSGAEEHVHSMQALDQDHGAGTYVNNSPTDVNVVQVGNYNTDPASSLPSYYEVVWVMRIK